jgi:hypothetical protein
MEAESTSETSVDFYQTTDDGGSKDLWNVGKLLPDYTALQPRRQPSSLFLFLFAASVEPQTTAPFLFTHILNKFSTHEGLSWQKFT